jgi:hypothetical protein
VYFSRGYPSSVKGGTAIAAGVVDREQHAARLADPEGYRPGPCRHCGGKLHAHDYATRSPVGEAPVEIRRYACPRCGGVVRVLPEFLARSYWRLWEVDRGGLRGAAPAVGQGLAAFGSPMAGTRPEAGRAVLHVMSASGDPRLAELVAGVGLAATRHELLVALGRWMRSHAVYAAAAVLANLLLPGLRVM